MKEYIEHLTELGYDTAIKTWAKEYVEKGYYLMAWIPGKAKETMVSLYNRDVDYGLSELIDKIEEKSNEV